MKVHLTGKMRPLNYRVPDKVMFRGPKPETRGERQREKILPGRIQLLSHTTKKCGLQVLISKVVQVLIVKKDGEDRKEKKCDEI